MNFETTSHSTHSQLCPNKKQCTMRSTLCFWEPAIFSCTHTYKYCFTTNSHGIYSPDMTYQIHLLISTILVRFWAIKFFIFLLSSYESKNMPGILLVLCTSVAVTKTFQLYLNCFKTYLTYLCINTWPSFRTMCHNSLC